MSSTVSESSSQSLVERASTFVSEHKQAIIVGAAAAVALGGVIYYTSTAGDEGRRKKKRGKKGRKGDDGPILEEKKPRLEDDPDLQPITPDQLAAMPADERQTWATKVKERGNQAYKKNELDLAVALYTRAMDVAVVPDSVFYANRAACWLQYKEPEYEKAVEDANEALKLRPDYTKALGRRALALERLERFKEALRDYTALSVLQEFKDEATGKGHDRVLRALAGPEVERILGDKKPRIPPYSFMEAYFGAFRPRPIPELPENATEGDKILISAVKSLRAREYQKVYDSTNEAFEKGGFSSIPIHAEALNLRASFRFLWGDVEAAKADFEEAIRIMPSHTNSWVKIASVHMETGYPQLAPASFEEAIKQNPNDPDIYYHRGQVSFIHNDFAAAEKDYRKTIDLDTDFVFGHVQLAVCQYKAGNTAAAMASFRRALKQFPQHSEPQNYYGELLLDQGRLVDAIEKFDRAIELEKAANKPRPNVLSIVNKALAIYQAQMNMDATETLLREALELDPDCEPAVITLAQISLQKGNWETAAEMFKKQAEIARVPQDLLNAKIYQYSAEAQIEFVNNFPQFKDKLSTMIPPSFPGPPQ